MSLAKREIRGIKLSSWCSNCDGWGEIGEKEYLPRISFKEQGGFVYSDNKCRECAGLGERLTQDGLEILEFMETFCRGRPPQGLEPSSRLVKSKVER